MSTRRPCVCLTNEHISPPRLFRERLSQLRLRLEEVGAERAPEYTEPLGGLQRSLKIRIQVAGLWAPVTLPAPSTFSPVFSSLQGAGAFQTNHSLEKMLCPCSRQV